MKLNKKYEETCENSGNGVFAELYKDFGDVRPDGEGAFWSWWGKNGTRHGRLFQERTLMPKAKIIRSLSDCKAPMGTYPYVLIAVDLHMGIRAAEKMISNELRKGFNKNPGRSPMRKRFSTARYKLSSYGDTKLFKSCYVVYKALTPIVEQYGEIGRVPSREISKIVMRLRRVTDKDIRELYEQAENWVDWVGKGAFPGEPLRVFNDWERIFDNIVCESGAPIHYMD